MFISIKQYLNFYRLLQDLTFLPPNKMTENATVITAIGGIFTVISQATIWIIITKALVIALNAPYFNHRQFSYVCFTFEK